MSWIDLRRSGKRTSAGLALALITLLFLCTGWLASTARAAVPPRAHSLQPDTVVAVEPARMTVDVGARFEVEISITGVSDLAGYELRLTFDPAVVRGVSLEGGGFVDDSGRTTLAASPVVDNTTGRVSYAVVSMGDSPGAEGDGVLARITLEGVTDGISDLTLSELILLDTDSARILRRLEHGRVTVGAGPSPTPEPTAPPQTPAPDAPTATAETPEPGDTPPPDTPTATAETPEPEDTPAPGTPTATRVDGTPEETLTAEPTAVVGETPATGEPDERDTTEHRTEEGETVGERADDRTFGWVAGLAVALAVLGVLFILGGTYFFRPEQG